MRCISSYYRWPSVVIVNGSSSYFALAQQVTFRSSGGVGRDGEREREREREKREREKEKKKKRNRERRK